MNRKDFRLVFLDAATFGDIALERFTTRWKCEIYQHSIPSEVLTRLKGYQAVVLNKVALDRTLLDSPEARALQLVAVAATGTDNVDLMAARAQGIRVCNVPGYATQSVAQFTLGMILELASRPGGYGELVRKGAWQKSPIFTLLDFPTVELTVKTLGIIGYGSIGQAVARMAQGFGMEVLISARPGLPGPAPEGRLPLNELLSRSDVVTLHCPLNPQTRNLINSRSLALMKPTSFLVNTARGALVDQNALIEALKNNRLAGAALDVLSQEPPSANHPIIKAAEELGNLILTPHCAWATREARQRLLDEVAENIQAYTRGQERNCVV